MRLSPGKENALFKIGLLKLSEDLRMQSNGSADPWDAEFRADVRAYLTRRLNTWKPSPSLYDAAVCALVVAALDEDQERNGAT